MYCGTSHLHLPEPPTRGAAPARWELCRRATLRDRLRALTARSRAELKALFTVDAPAVDPWRAAAALPPAPLMHAPTRPNPRSVLRDLHAFRVIGVFRRRRSLRRGLW
jgi:hypothetical protein